ncbi:MAG: hypothetical protein Q9182_007439 [Xanthomendoza sp. 2 TL-2023]
MSVQILSARLQLLIDSHKQTLHQIHRLSKSAAAPGLSSLDPEAGGARLELSIEIHQSLKEQQEVFDLLHREVEDQINTAGWTSSARRRFSRNEKERTDLAAQIARLGEDLKLARSHFRKAQLQAKRNAEAAQRRKRELLFAGVREGATAPAQDRRKGHDRSSKDQVELNASSDVTAALRRVHSLMQSEVSRSQFALETLRKSMDAFQDLQSLKLPADQSTAALSTLSESYTRLDTLLLSSRSLLSTLLHSRKSDTWYLESAFWILVVTIGWLFFRRILYGPGWWLLYLPTTLMWRTTLSSVNILFGIFASIAGAKNQSVAPTQPYGRVSSILLEQPTASGGIPTFDIRMSAPSIQVGGGGKGQPPPQHRQGEHSNASKEVGKSAKKTSETTCQSSSTSASQTQAAVLREREPDEPPNTKKRMWEENIASQGDVPPRDEL